jgi:predicted RNase H-like nuclease (RuvC/YqgF family)
MSPKDSEMLKLRIAELEEENDYLEERIEKQQKEISSLVALVQEMAKHMSRDNLENLDREKMIQLLSKVD